MNQEYSTSELEIASFLKARGNELTDARLLGRVVTFSFEASAKQDVNAYFSGATLPATQLFEAHRSLRLLIRQLQAHNMTENQEKRTDKQNDNTALQLHQ